MTDYCVYKHTAPNGKCYIGITSKKPEHRWNHGRAYYQNKYFTHAIQKYGWDNFQHEVLFTGLSKQEACNLERQLIKQYKSNDLQNGYNLSAGGENPSEGSHRSEEINRKMSILMTGKKHDFAFRQKISAAKKGRPNGLEGRKGKDCSKSGMVIQIDETTKEIIQVFFGFDEMQRKTGYSKTPVREAANGIRHRAYGYLWQYKKREII